METVNIMVTTPIETKYLDMISAVSPRVIVHNASDIAKADMEGYDDFSGEFDTLLAKTEVIYGFRLPRNFLDRAPNLKWIQVMSAGVDRFLTSEFLRSPVMLTNVSGIHTTPIGEFVMEQTLMFVKGAARCFEMKQQKQWARYNSGILRGKTVGIVGLGSIGKEVARLSRSFGMRVLAMRRSSLRTKNTRNVDLMLSREELPQLMAESDFVVITLPYTPETDKIIGEKELTMMKSTACIINIGRGRIIDEEALVRALSTNRIAGAGLDVFATEPLPLQSKLWELPNVLFSPHVSGGMEDYNLHATTVFCDNLKRFLEGKRLFNVVGKKRGY